MNGSSSNAGRLLWGWLVALSLLQLAACARERKYGVDRDHDGAEREEDIDVHDQESDGHEDDEDEDADPGASASEPKIAALMDGLFTEYIRDTVARCPCHVLVGSYESVDDCVATVTRHPLVSSCLDEAIPADTRQELRNWLRCITDAKREHNRCLESMSCEAQETCRNESYRCPMPDAVRLTNALNECPRSITVAP